MSDSEHSYGYSDGQVAMALAVLYAGQRAPQHPRRVAWALHIVAPDNPQHARLRYCCSLCPPCDHENLLPPSDRFQCHESVHIDMRRRAALAEREAIIAWLRSEAERYLMASDRALDAGHTNIGKTLRFASIEFHRCADAIERDEHNE